MKPPFLAIIVVALLALLSGCLQAPPSGAPKTVSLSLGPSHFAVQAEVADTESSRELGLMNRPALAENQGMLFVFPSSQSLTFWMANTTIPLEILFLNSGGTVVDIQEMAPCGSADWSKCHIYPSAAPAQFALELNANFSARHGVQLGQKIQIPKY